AAALHSLATRGGARTLCTGAGSNQPAASVLAHRRRRAQGHRRLLHRARALESGGEGRSRCGLLFRLAGIRRHRQRGAADRCRSGRGHARRAPYSPPPLRRRLGVAPARRSQELEVRMRCRVVSLPLAFSVALVVAALGTVAQSQTLPGTWTQKAPMPAVRGEVAAAAVGDKLFALGGGVAGKA